MTSPSNAVRVDETERTPAPLLRTMPNRVIEPRYFPRADLTAVAQVRVEGRVCTWHVVNVSEGGVSLRAGELPARDASIAIEFTLPDGLVVTAGARVVWAERRGNADVGIEFTDVSEDSLAAIREFVETREPMAWDPASALPRETAVRFVPVIRRIAFSMSRRTGGRFPAEDLVGVGFLALVEAHVRYDATLGVAFDAYAAVRIRGAMLDELRSVDPMSRSARRFKRTRDDVLARLGAKLERMPSQEEMAAELNMPLGAYQESLAAIAIETVSIDAPREHEGATYAQPLASEEPTPEEQAVSAESARRVERAVAALPPRLRQVLDMYFGENRTMRDIGAVLGVSESRISQLVTSAIGRVREGLAEPEAPASRRQPERITGVRRKSMSLHAAVR